MTDLQKYRKETGITGTVEMFKFEAWLFEKMLNEIEKEMV